MLILNFNLKKDECANYPENSSTTKTGYSMSTIWTLDRGKDCMKKFCESLREHTKTIIDFEKKKLLRLTKEELKSHQDAKVRYFCGKRILKKLSKRINCRKVWDHRRFAGKCRGAAYSICNLKFNLPNEIQLVFRKG